MAMLWAVAMALVGRVPMTEVEGWLGLPDDGGAIQLSLPVLPTELGEPAPGDVSVRVAPGRRTCVLLAEGGWLEDLVGNAPSDATVSVAIRLLEGDCPVFTVVYADAAGLEGELCIRLDPEPGIWRRVHFPARVCVRGARTPQLLLVFDHAMAVDLAGWRLDPSPSARPDLGDWPAVELVSCGLLISSFVESLARGACGWVTEAEAADLRERTARVLDLEATVDRLLAEDWERAVISGGGRADEVAVRLGRLEDATGAPLRPPSMGVDAHGRRLVLGAAERWGRRADAYVLLPRGVTEPGGLLPFIGLTTPDESRPDVQDEEPSAPSDHPELQAAWTRFLRDRYGSDRALRTAWRPPPGMRHGLSEHEGIDGQISPPYPPLATDVRLADYLDWAGEAWTGLADSLSKELRTQEPRGLLFVAPLAVPLQGAAPGWEWSLASLTTAAGLPSALWRCPDPLSARFCLSGSGPGARQTGMALADRWLKVEAVESRGLASVLRDTASLRRASVAVVCSRRELVLGRSLAPGLLAALDDLGVDADVLSDAALVDAPDIQSRYKVLIYETGSLDARAFATAWACGLPTLFVGPVDEDAFGARGRDGAQRILAAHRAFITRPGPVERVPTAPAAIGLAITAAGLLDPFGTLGQRRHSSPDPKALPIPDLPQLAHRAWRWTFFEGPPVPRPLESVWHLEVAPCPPLGTSIYVNGRPVAQVGLSTCATPGRGVWRTSVPGDALFAIRRNEIGVRIPPGGEDADYYLSAAALRPYPRGDMVVTASLPPVALNGVLSYPVDVTRLAPRPDAIAPGVTVLGVYAAGNQPALLRHGNRLLWAGPAAVAEHDGTVYQVLAAFMGMLGEAHVYPPIPRNTGLAVAEGGGGAAVILRSEGVQEVDLSTNRALIASHSRPLPWQRIQSDGRSVVPLTAQGVGSTMVAIPTELELRPTGPSMVARWVLRDTTDPERLVLTGELEGPGQGVIHSPFDGLWRASGLVGGRAVPMRGSGQQARFEVPAGRHRFRVEVRCPGAGILSSRLYTRYRE